MSKIDQNLASELGRPAAELGFMEVLKAADQRQLVADIEAARKAHARQIRACLEEALEHIPRLIRGPIRKLFGV